jgi:hypothetical protein
MGKIESLEGTLVSVLENRPADCEILVALSAPYADPYDLQGEVRFVESRPTDSVVTSIRRASSETRAPFVHLLASGCRVWEGWADKALARFGDRTVGSVAPLVVQLDQPERIFAAGVGYKVSGKRFRVGAGATQLAPDAASAMVGPCLAAAFYRKSAFDLVGGLAPQLGAAQADVDLAFALRQVGFTIVVEPQSRVFADRDIEPAAAPFQQALADERLFWRNLPRQGRLAAIGAHLGLVAAEVACSFPRPRMLAQMAGRVRALLGLRGCLHARNRPGLVGPEHSGRPQAGVWRVDRSHAAAGLGESPSRRAPSH